MADSDDLFDEADMDDLENTLRRQEESLALLERLRIMEPAAPPKERENGPRGRRDFRRWPAPEGVTLELHNGSRWQAIQATDMGIGGARIVQTPAWMLGPAPARLKAPTGFAILVLADVMWRDAKADAAGLRFEFLDTEERDQWADSLLDALLARYSVG